VAGKQMFVDFPGQTAPVYDQESGVAVMEAQIFVSVRGASKYVYAEAPPSQQLVPWINAHARAFSFYGGCTEVAVMDYVARNIIDDYHTEYPAEELPALLEPLDHLGHGLRVGGPAELVPAHAGGQDQSLDHSLAAAGQQSDLAQPSEVGLELVTGLAVGDPNRLPTADLELGLAVPGCVR
jgi:hypothetical protein